MDNIKSKGFFIFLSLFSLCLSIPQIPSIELSPKTTITEELHCMELCLGTGKAQCFSAELSLSSFLLVIPNKTEVKEQLFTSTFIPSESPTFTLSNKNFTLRLATGNETQGFVATDTLTLGSIQIDNINFVLANSLELSMGCDGIIGLGYNPNGLEEYSIIEQLYEKKFIFHKIFSVDFSTVKPHMMIGDVSNVIINDYQNYGTCKLLQRDPRTKQQSSHWQCNVNSIKLENLNEVVPLNTPVLFSLNHTNTYLPYSLFNYIQKEFRSLLNEYKCSFIVNPNSIILSCNEGVILPSLTLNFDKWSVTIDHKKNLYDGRTGNNHVYYFKENEEKFVLGKNVLKHFTVVFDKENSVVGLYNPDLVSYIGNGPIEKPTYNNNNKGLSTLARDDKEAKKEFEDIRGKVTGTLWLFGFLVIGTISIAVTMLVMKRKIKDVRKNEIIEPLYHGDNNSELSDIDIKSSSNAFAIN